MSASDNIIFVNTSAARTLTLPAPTNGRLLIIKDSTGNAATNNITINPNASETIDGASSFIISFNWGEVQLQSNGTNWFTNKVANNTLSLAAFGSTPNANGLSLSGATLNMQPADGTNPGGVSITTQTFAGAKTFTSALTAGVTGGTNTFTGGETFNDNITTELSFLFRNQDTTTSTSNSAVKIRVGGTASGDPYIQYRVTGGSDWSVGIDNSDADKYKVSQASGIGSNDYFVVDTAGIITIGAASGTQVHVVNGSLSTTLDIAITTAGKGLQIKEGTNAKMGTATMVAGTVTVSTTAVTASSRIFLTVQSLGTVAVATPVAVTARTAGTSFTISSSAITDTSVVAWMLVEPA